MQGAEKTKCSEERFYLGHAPQELVEESNRFRKQRRQRQRANLLRKTRETEFRYYCSLCLIIRDENEYLEEWLRWHLDIGVEHFYIYDHGSKQSVRKFVNGLGREIAEKVTVIDWSGKHKDAQPDAYNDCLNRFRGESRWIGFVDTDEQIEVKTGQSLPEFLKGYERYAGLFAIWVTYGANGQEKQTEGLLRERFTEVSHGDKWAEHVGKVIVQPMYMTDMVIHNGKAADGFEIVDEEKRKIYNYSLLTEYPTRNKICVNHYYTKSYEEWMNKLRRGSGHAKFSRRYEEFFNINPEMEYCRENIEIYQQYEEFE